MERKEGGEKKWEEQWLLCIKDKWKNVSKEEREGTKQGFKKSVGGRKERGWKILSRVRRERGCKTKIENSVKRKKKGVAIQRLEKSWD